MAFLSREEEIELIVQSLEANARKIRKEIAPYEGKLLSENHGKILSRLRKNIGTIEHTVNLYVKELEDIRWGDVIEGITDKM